MECRHRDRLLSSVLLGSVTFARQRKENPQMAITESVGRFSCGQERLDATSLTRIGRFSDGQERLAKHPEHVLVGRFSAGQELLGKTAEQARVGHFSDRQGRRSIPVQRQADTTDRLEMETATS
jgi:hypothetical protein